MLTDREKKIIDIFMDARQHLPLGHPNQRLGQALFYTVMSLDGQYKYRSHKIFFNDKSTQDPYNNDENIYGFIEKVIDEHRVK